jgi:hypothetical protein
MQRRYEVREIVIEAATVTGAARLEIVTGVSVCELHFV